MSAVIPDPATTDWVPLGGIGIQGGLIPISEIVLGAAGPIDFTNIPATYAHLMLACSLRSANATASAIAALRFNGDNTALYASWGFGSQLTAALALDGAVALAAPGTHRAFEVPGGSAGASVFGAGQILIPDYANTARWKSWKSEGGMADSTANAASVHVKAGKWQSTAAINRIEILSGGASVNFAAGSRATLYGLAAPGVTYLPQATRVVSGTIDGPTGAITVGSGFTCTRTAAGRFTITPSVPFASAPVVVGSVLNAVPTSGSFFVVTASAASFTVATASPAGTITDYHFSFHAIGV